MPRTLRERASKCNENKTYVQKNERRRKKIVRKREIPTDLKKQSRNLKKAKENQEKEQTRMTYH